MPEEESADRGGGSVGAGVGGLAAEGTRRTGRSSGRGGEEPKDALSPSGFRRVVQVI